PGRERPRDARHDRAPLDLQGAVARARQLAQGAALKPARTSRALAVGLTLCGALVLAQGCASAPKKSANEPRRKTVLMTQRAGAHTARARRGAAPVRRARAGAGLRQRAEEERERAAPEDGPDDPVRRR